MAQRRRKKTPQQASDSTSRGRPRRLQPQTQAQQPRHNSAAILISVSIVSLLAAIAFAFRSNDSSSNASSSGVDVEDKPLLVYPYKRDGVTVFSNKTGEFGVVKVVETETLRLLIADKSVIGGRFTDPRLENVALFTGFAIMEAAAFAYVPDHSFDAESKRSALVLGLGVGGLVRHLSSHYQVDAVELDPLVIDAARTHFSLSRDRTLYHADALEFAAYPEQYSQSSSSPRYALIIHDLFTSGTNSLTCLSRVSLAHVKENLLAEHGILLVNFVSFYRDSDSDSDSDSNSELDSGSDSDSKHSRLARSIVKTLRSLFANVHCYVDHEPDEHALTTCNILCFCADSGRVRFKLPDSVTKSSAGDSKYSAEWVQQHFQEWEVFPEVETADAEVVTEKSIGSFANLQDLIHRESTGFVHEMVPAWVWD